ncbi:hypothetical protein E8E11_008358 [Didymella keratinophila]|nr:hypothetical protein E8E11_008358 [Didymella keratinophila]
MSTSAPDPPSQALVRRNEPTNAADHAHLLDVHLSNIATTAQASRMRLRAAQLWWRDLEQQTEKAILQKEAYAKQLLDLQTKYREVVIKLQISRLQTIRLRVELGLVRHKGIRRSGRKRHDGTR